ncbi:alpha/beta hydrolase [Stenotrophomonas indicatrix]|jgi:predicted alpha/beta superfamily hydrolase|uniref:alpha/beta hydrolase n=1 Tax=Stenotrophomonas indicatrix TaxID=2045451 RepID=UPI000739785C|nr:alpha/beta hydrolase-fold protein [Stenotrophomonas indicatrix]OJH79661.1 MAG: esterase [Stenotrophomonas maltophilia]QXQ04492.1 alpha/beta hydrolase [Stenotrophomonas indicatrix]CRD50856.1 putative esterase [Stenotrophomonas indicatrix]
MKSSVLPPRRGPLLSGLAALMMGLLLATPYAYAQQRNPLQKMGQTVLDAPAASYRFERFVIDSPDQQRRWRVNVAIPAKAPKAPSPVLYALDGNAVAMVLDQPLLAELAARKAPPVLVLIGYDNDLRIDSASRTRDYTAWIDRADDESGRTQAVGGGAAAFLDMIERRIKPEVERRANIDRQQQALWGHSLGGLFVLSSLYTRPAAFQYYLSASPSLWWSQGAPLGDIEQQFVQNVHGQPAKVWLMLGGAERVGDRGKRDMSNPRVVAHLRRIGGATPDAAMQLSERLGKVPGLSVQYREFPGLGHGPMLPASFHAALHELYGVTDRSAADGQPAGGDNAAE